MEEGVLAGGVEVGGDHFSAHFLDGGFRDPTGFGLGFGSVAEQSFDFGRAVIAGIDLDDDIADGDAGAIPLLTAVTVAISCSAVPLNSKVRPAEVVFAWGSRRASRTFRGTAEWWSIGRLRRADRTRPCTTRGRVDGATGCR